MGPHCTFNSAFGSGLDDNDAGDDEGGSEEGDGSLLAEGNKADCSVQRMVTMSSLTMTMTLNKLTIGENNDEGKPGRSGGGGVARRQSASKGVRKMAVQRQETPIA